MRLRGASRRALLHFREICAKSARRDARARYRSRIALKYSGALLNPYEVANDHTCAIFSRVDQPAAGACPRVNPTGVTAGTVATGVQPYSSGSTKRCPCW